MAAEMSQAQEWLWVGGSPPCHPPTSSRGIVTRPRFWQSPDAPRGAGGPKRMSCAAASDEPPRSFPPFLLIPRWPPSIPPPVRSRAGCASAEGSGRSCDAQLKTTMPELRLKLTAELKGFLDLLITLCMPVAVNLCIWVLNPWALTKGWDQWNLFLNFHSIHKAGEQWNQFLR